MSVGLLIVTHNKIGSVLLDTATKMLGFCPLLTQTMAISNDCNPDQIRQGARSLVVNLDQGDGVLVLTDMYGSTPSNIATSLSEPGRVKVVAGVNLPMLVRVLNYPHLSLESITNKALSGGCDGILLCGENDT